MHDEIVISLEQPVVEIKDTAHEFRGKDADAAIVEQIDPSRTPVDFEHRVVAEMGVAVDDTIAAKRPPPRGEHGGAEDVAGCEIVIPVREQPVPIEPIEGEEATCRKLGPNP